MSRAEELRASAAKDLEKREDSFERSDTDGFMSQWALGLSAQKKQVQADIEDRGGVSDFPCLYDGDRRVNAKLIEAKFGHTWLLADSEAERYERRFIPFDGSHNVKDGDLGRSRIQKKLGLEQYLEEAPAKAKIDETGTGLSGNAWVVVYRTDMNDWETGDNANSDNS